MYYFHSRNHNSILVFSDFPIPSLFVFLFFLLLLLSLTTCLFISHNSVLDTEISDKFYLFLHVYHHYSCVSLFLCFVFCLFYLFYLGYLCWGRELYYLKRFFFFSLFSALNYTIWFSECFMIITRYSFSYTSFDFLR